MGFKIVENFDASFTLNTEARDILFSLLKNQTFTDQISEKLHEKAMLTATCAIAFTELLFQPVPYSQHTPKGMPREFEKYHNCDEYIIINVPPNFMFQAKIFQPSRLCAIYRRL
jgi:hypothetical protein